MPTQGLTGMSEEVRALLEQQIAQAMRRLADGDGAGAGRAAGALRQMLDQAQEALTWSPDERLRRGLLQALMARLAALGPDRLRWQLQTVEPFGVTGLVVTARGIPGAAQVIVAATGARGGEAKRHYASFPPGAAVQYELRVTTGPADGWASRPAPLCRRCGSC